MLAVVKEHAGPGFSVKDVPCPELRSDDVIIKVRSVGICGTDGPILAGTREVPWPLIPGLFFQDRGKNRKRCRFQSEGRLRGRWWKMDKIRWLRRFRDIRRPGR